MRSTLLRQSARLGPCRLHEVHDRRPLQGGEVTLNLCQLRLQLLQRQQAQRIQ